MNDETNAHTQAAATFDDVLAEYIAGEEAGAAPDRRALLARHPKFAQELQEFFANRDQMQRLAEPLRGTANAGRGATPLGKIRYFGDYELLEEVAAGGMGIVYKARQRSLNRIVAVKMILKGTLAREEDVKRFRAEAEAAANLQHPGIVAIHEVGLHEGQHYFSMDFVEGHSLAELPREQPLSARQAAEYVRDAAEAVHYAHQQGTLHRDLKPSNILIDHQGRVRITDFGLARRIEGGSDLTLTGQVLGTPSYMPPEQALGKRSLISAASDIYSLGAVLYELLTDRPPFRGESPVETLRQVETLDPLLPRLLRPAVPRDLETICLKCLEKEPHKRYGTAQLLADDLGRYLRGEPIVARPVSRVERAWRWCKRNPAIASLLASVAACLILGTVVSSYFAIQEAIQRRRADDKAAEALREKANAESSSADAEKRKVEAEANAAIAEKRRTEAEESARLARRHLYAANMSLAQLSWESGWGDQAAQLLDAFRVPAEQTGGPDDLRGFEWFLWDRYVHSDLFTLKGHTHIVTSVSFSPDGKRLASADLGGMVKFWNTGTGQELRTVIVTQPIVDGEPIAKFLVRCVAFSPDWKWMASSHGDPKNAVMVWDVATAKQIINLKGLGEWANWLVFSPDGARLAAVSDSRRLHVWDVATGEELIKLNGEQHDSVKSVAFSPDGTRLFATWNGIVHVWDATTGQELKRVFGTPGWVYSLAFNHNGTRLASANLDQTVSLWNFNPREILLNGQSQPFRPRESLQTLKGHMQPVKCVAFSPDGKWLVSGSEDHTIKMWDVESGKESISLRGHSGGINVVAFSPDGGRLASGSDDRSVKIWDPAANYQALKLVGHTSSLRQVVFSPDGNRLATSCNDNTVRVWDADTGQTLFTFKLASIVRRLAYSPDGKKLAAACERGATTVWDATSGDELFVLQENAGKYVDFSPVDQRLATASHSAVTIWNAGTGEKLFTVESANQNLPCLAYSPDGKYLAATGSNGVIRLMNPDTGQEVTTLTPSTALIQDLAFSPDGKSIAFSNGDGTTKLWDVRTSKEMLVINAHSAIAHCVKFSPDGKRLVSAGSDTAVKLWDIETGQQLISLKATGSVASVAFSPDGLRLAVAGFGGAQIWDARSAKTRALSRNHLPSGGDLP